MNRAQRRLYNKKHHTKWTKTEFEAAIALERLKQGGVTYDDIKDMRNVAHMDNFVIAPDGCVVKLNYEDIYKRPQADLTDEFKAWIEENKDKELHLTREGASESLVCIEEDERYAEVDGVITRKPRWLFDLYSDLLLKRGDEFKHPYEVDDESNSDYTDITGSLNLMESYLSQTEKNEEKEEKSEETEKTEENSENISENA